MYASKKKEVYKKWDNIKQVSNREMEALLIEPFYDERWSEKKEAIQINDNLYQINKMYTEPIFNIELLPGSVLVLNDQQFEGLDQEPINFYAILLDDDKKHADLAENLIA